MAKSPVQAKDDNQDDLIDQLENQDHKDQNGAGAGAGPEVIDPEPEPEPEEASVLLQKQIDALKKSEEIQKSRVERYREEAEAAQRLAQERAIEVTQHRKDVVQSRLDSITTALASSQSESESAKRDIKSAIANGDVDAQADAYERLAAARANITRLEESKFDLEERAKTPPQPEPQPNALPQRIQRWLQRHPEMRTDPRKNDRLRSLHWDVLDEGHEFDSDEYIESMEIKLGMRNNAEEDPVVVPLRQQQRTPIVSAPVSREAPSTPGNTRGEIRLTPAQREAAKTAGVTEKVYAENLAKINKMKADGTYGGQQ